MLFHLLRQYAYTNHRKHKPTITVRVRAYVHHRRPCECLHDQQPATQATLA